MASELIKADLDRDAASGCGPLVPSLTTPQRGLRLQVFQRIRAAGLISRTDLARELDVSPASVTSTTSELIERGLITEVAGERSSDVVRGRPPVALGVCAEFGAVAGLRLSDHVHTAVVLDFAGRRLGEASLRSSGLQVGLDALAASAQELVGLAAVDAGMQVRDLAAIGIGMPGLIDQVHGLVRWSPILSQTHAPLRDALEARLARPVIIDNDANVVALAELWFGAGRSESDFAVVTIEYGVGMGLVQNHALYRGVLGSGMELGHTKVQLDGALCRCGRRGCLEAYIADYALMREATTALNWGDRIAPAGEVLETLYGAARRGDAVARAIFDRAGRYLALGLANVVNLFDPRLIILSGARMRYEYLYADTVLAEMAEMSMGVGRRPPKVEINAWGDLVWAQGAAAMALEHATSAALFGERAAA